MSTKTKFEICNLMVETVRKDIKNIHLGVYPPNGRIRVAAPLKTSDESVRLLVISKIPWIKKQQSRFMAQERQTKREYISGESHYFLGKRYLLNVIDIEPIPRIEIKRKAHIHMYVKPNSTLKHREKLLEDWYRSEIKKQIALLLEKWSKIIGVRVNKVSVRKMKTKWGTCNTASKRILLNLELAKKPAHCLEYVFVHEMIHILEKKHSDKFMTKMDSFMPNWKQLKQELNKSPLSYSEWSY